MGSYAHLYIRDYPIVWTKNDVDPYVMTIFRETDRRVFQQRVKDRNPLTWGVSKSRSLETAYEYTCTVEHAKNRLGVMGFTLDRAKRHFEESKMGRIENLQEWGLDLMSGHLL